MLLILIRPLVACMMAEADWRRLEAHIKSALSCHSDMTIVALSLMYHCHLVRIKLHCSLPQQIWVLEWIGAA